VESSTIPVRSQWVSRGVHLRVDPGEVGLLAMEEPRDGINQHVIGRPGLETAGLFEGQDPLHPAVALGARGPQGPLLPQDAIPQATPYPLHPAVSTILWVAFL
jgi:hypothetical protein